MGRGWGGAMGRDQEGLGYRAGPVTLILGRVGVKQLGQKAGCRSGHRWVVDHEGVWGWSVRVWEGLGGAFGARLWEV